MSATYTKPTKIPKWADSAASITEPSDGYKNEGWVFNTPPPAAYENWKSKLVGDWIKWFNERLFDGASKDIFVLKNPGAGTVVLTIGTTLGANVDFVGLVANATGLIGREYGVNFASAGHSQYRGVSGVGTGAGVYGEGIGDENTYALYGHGYSSDSATGAIGVGGYGADADMTGGIGGKFFGGEGPTTGGYGVYAQGGVSTVTGGIGGYFKGGQITDAAGVAGVGLQAFGGTCAVSLATVAGGVGAQIYGGEGGPSGDGGTGLWVVAGVNGTGGATTGNALRIYGGNQTHGKAIKAAVHLHPQDYSAIGGTPEEGDILYDSVSHTLKVRTAATWRTIAFV